MSKTHYRKVMKSDHLGVADLEDFIEAGKKLDFTISHVNQEVNVSVAGRKGNHNIAYFKEKIKPMVLNATNCKVVKSFCKNSPFVEDWKNVVVTLYIDPNVTMRGELVGGLRISKVQPKVQIPVKKEKTFFGDEHFEGAAIAKATIEMVKMKYKITPAMEKKYLDYVNKLK